MTDRTLDLSAAIAATVQWQNRFKDLLTSDDLDLLRQLRASLWRRLPNREDGGDIPTHYRRGTYVHFKSGQVTWRRSTIVK